MPRRQAGSDAMSDAAIQSERIRFNTIALNFAQLAAQIQDLAAKNSKSMND
jgi:hypothetical protein